MQGERVYRKLRSCLPGDGKGRGKRVPTLKSEVSFLKAGGGQEGTRSTCGMMLGAFLGREAVDLSHLQPFSGQRAAAKLMSSKGSETKRRGSCYLAGSENLGPSMCPHLESWLQPHRFFRGSAPRTCRTAVLLSDCIETGERKPPNQAWPAVVFLTLTFHRLPPRHPGVPAPSTGHGHTNTLCLERPFGAQPQSLPFLDLCPPQSLSMPEAKALPPFPRWASQAPSATSPEALP